MFHRVSRWTEPLATLSRAVWLDCARLRAVKIHTDKVVMYVNQIAPLILDQLTIERQDLSTLPSDFSGY